jgi:hypothetical protein
VKTEVRDLSPEAMPGISRLNCGGIDRHRDVAGMPPGAGLIAGERYHIRGALDSHVAQVQVGNFVVGAEPDSEISPNAFALRNE